MVVNDGEADHGWSVTGNPARAKPMETPNGRRLDLADPPEEVLVQLELRLGLGRLVVGHGGGLGSVARCQLRHGVHRARDDLDEPDIEIRKDDAGKWHVRDFGRGLQYDHLTQKENDEKLNNPNMIGKFGIGLKDALATFDRHSIKVLIKSKYGDITLGKSEKYGFEDVVTLHAYISSPSDAKFIGTQFILEGVQDEDIARAKDLFLKFSGETGLETTKFGEVLKKRGALGRIYINGVRVAEEDNFLFSYNITSLTETIRRALNRERSNVGRTAYSERVRAMLNICTSKTVVSALAEDLKTFDAGTVHDDLKWLDVQEHAVKILNSQEKVVFLTAEEMIKETMMVDEAKSSGYKIITIPTNLKEMVRG